MEFYYSEYLEGLTANIEFFNKSDYLMKEQLTDFSHIEKIKRIEIKFDDLHIAISKNGGLIALCMKKGHYDISKKSRLNKNIIVMFQNSKTKYTVPIDWNNKDRYVVCLDFTPKQDLYAILNDGSVYKIKYNEGKAKKKLTSEKFKGVEIVKAKLFEKGFVAFTNISQFYYVKNIKNIFPVLICYLTPFLQFDLNVDFIPIPADNTASKKIEILITKQDGNGGIIQIPLKEEGENVSMLPIDEKGAYFEIIGASHITKECPHKLIIQSTPDGNDDKKKKKSKKKKEENVEPPKIENIGTQPDIGLICAIAISPDNEKVAFYNRENKKAFLFNTEFTGNYQEVCFTCKSSVNYDQHKKEVEDALNYPEGCQFLFFGNDYLVLSYQRVIIISTPNIKLPVIYVASEENIGKGKLVSKCITEVDGLRVLTNEGVSLISKVPKELYNISDEFSKSASKRLIDIYKNTMNRKYKSDRDINSLKKFLPNAIEELQNASACIYWTDDINEKEQKETQLFILKVAQFAKKFVDKDEFNFEKFNQNCKDMRIINYLRNDKKYPVYITYKEYKEILNTQDLISVIIKYNNFQAAANICKFLDYGMNKVLDKYVIAVMKREIDDMEKTLNKNASSEEIKQKYELLFLSLERVQGVSFMKLAKKANKYGGKKLAQYLLEQEKSDLVKIPMLLQLKDNFDQTIQIAFDSYDFNAVIKVMTSLDKQNMIKIITRNSLYKYFRKILLYLKIYDKSKIFEFLEKTKNFVEIYYLNIKTFYKQKTLDDRISALKICRNDLKHFDKNDLFDVKGAKKFLDKLENIAKFKSVCASVDKGIIHYTEQDPQKVSVYDCFKKGFTKDQGNWLEAQNKTIEYSQKKLNLIKFRSYLEMRRPDAIENQLQKTPLKKLGLSPIHLAEVFYDYKYYNEAAKWLVQVKDPAHFSFAADLFKNMKKPKEWLEFIISNKNIDDKLNLVNRVLAAFPGNERFVDEFCTKYKVNLN